MFHLTIQDYTLYSFFIFWGTRDDFPNEKVPTLIETVETCVTLGLQMMIEVKQGRNSKKASSNYLQIFGPATEEVSVWFWVGIDHREKVVLSLKWTYI